MNYVPEVVLYQLRPRRGLFRGLFQLLLGESPEFRIFFVELLLGMAPQKPVEERVTGQNGLFAQVLFGGFLRFVVIIT